MTTFNGNWNIILSICYTCQLYILWILALWKFKKVNPSKIIAPQIPCKNFTFRKQSRWKKVSFCLFYLHYNDLSIWKSEIKFMINGDCHKELRQKTWRGFAFKYILRNRSQKVANIEKKISCCECFDKDFLSWNLASRHLKHEHFPSEKSAWMKWTLLGK